MSIYSQHKKYINLFKLNWKSKAIYSLWFELLKQGMKNSMNLISL
jgi:hypothetical protein